MTKRRHQNTRMAGVKQDPETKILTVASPTGEDRPIVAADTTDWYTRDGDAELAQLTQQLDQGANLSQAELERLLLGAETYFSDYQRKSLLAAVVAGAVLVRIRDRIQAGRWNGDPNFGAFLNRIGIPRRSAYDFIDLATYRARTSGYATCRTVRDALAQVREIRAQEKGDGGVSRRSAADALIETRRRLEVLQQGLETADPDQRPALEVEIRTVERQVSELAAVLAAQAVTAARVQRTVSLTDEQSQQLDEHARQRRLDPETLLHTVVVQWLNRNRRSLGEFSDVVI